MGSFVAIVTAHLHPDLVGNLVLVDGSLPPNLGPPAQLPSEDVIKAVIGPSLERLRMTVESEAAYLDFWRARPALERDWGEYMEEYLRYRSDR